MAFRHLNVAEWPNANRVFRPLMWTALGLFVGLVAVLWLSAAVGWSSRINESDVALDYGIAVLWAIGLGVLVSRFPGDSDERVALMVVWIAKCVTALGLMLPYEAFYDLDAFEHWERGQRLWYLSDFFKNLGKGTPTLQALISFSSYILPSGYHATKMTFSFLGLAGIYCIHRGLNYALGPSVRRIYWLGLMPSVLFWTTIVGKDPFVFLGIGVFFMGVCQYLATRSRSSVVTAVIGVGICALIRGWLVAIFCLSLAFASVTARLSIRRKIFLVIVLAIAMPYVFSMLPEDFIDLDGMIDQVNAVNRGFAVGRSGQGQWRINGWADLIEKLPFGMFTAIFRPLPGEIPNLGGILAGVENLFLLIFFVFALFRTGRELILNPHLTWAMITLLTWAIIYAPVSSGNLGTGARFRLQALPFMLLIIFWRPRAQQAPEKKKEPKRLRTELVPGR